MPQQNINRDAAPAAVVEAVAELGRNISTARVRRKMRQDDLAVKSGITRNTLRRVEAGALGTGIGAYVAVLWALGLHDQLASVASPDLDLEGKTLEAARRGERVRVGQELSDDF